jgi:DNA polymerase III delta prime subunit
LEKDLAAIQGATAGAHPDFSYHRFESLGIKESRQLRQEQTGAPVAGHRRLVVIQFVSATPEAQQALLKVVEEPAPGTTWFFLTPAPEELLPTLLSRVWRLELTGEKKQEIPASTLQFIKAGYAERLAQIEKLVKKEEKRSLALELVDGLGDWARATLDLANLTPGWKLALKELTQVRTYLSDKAATVRLLLEHLALVWPSVEGIDK